MAAFLEAEEPITVEVLRRPPTSSTSTSNLTSNSRGSSKRNSAYIPSEIFDESEEINLEDVVEQAGIEPELSGDADPNYAATRDDLLVPDLDYEVSAGSEFSAAIVFPD